MRLAVRPAAFLLWQIVAILPAIARQLLLQRAYLGQLRECIAVLLGSIDGPARLNSVLL